MIAKEIKRAYDDWDYSRSTRKGGACGYSPFKNDNEWYYDYLYPEMLIVYEDYVKAAYKIRPKQEMSMTYLRWRESEYKSWDGRASIFPCWIMSEDDVLRIMIETGVMEGGKGNG